MKTVKLSDVATIYVSNPKVGDVAVMRNGNKVFIVSKSDVENMAKTKLGASHYIFISPVSITTDELLALLPGILAYVPFVGTTIKRLNSNSLKDLLIPDLASEAAFKSTLLSDKAKIDEAGAALAAAQVNYDKAVEKFVSYVKANLAKANK